MDQNIRYTRARLSASVVSKMTGPPLEKSQDNTNDRRIYIKIPDPAGNGTRIAWSENSNCKDHITASGNLVKIKVQYCNYRP